jgi:hypothetical protein
MLLSPRIISYLLINLTSDDRSKINEIIKHKDFTKINIIPEPCPILKRCSLFGCTHNINIILDTESKTNCSNGKEVWKKIYSHCNTNEMHQMVSGIHYAISVHISYNYYNLYFFFYHNVGKYLKCRRFYNNFIMLFVCITNKLKHKNNFYGNIYKKTENLVYAESINKILKEIGCLDCQKCRIFGTLYFKGLRSCLSNERTRDDMMFIILFYRKLLETIKMWYLLEKLL